jgi:hypothetical protein
MPTYYESRNVNRNAVHPTVAVHQNTRAAQLNKQGFIMLHRNNNYSNTMRPCVYVCERSKIRWI